MAIIHCQDCGLERKGPANTKYCHLCRLLRNVEHFANRRRSCSECKVQFPPIQHGDPWCGDCAMGESSKRGHCALCLTDNAYLVMRGVAVCIRCARSPEKRRPFIRGLRKKQDDQRAAVRDELEPKARLHAVDPPVAA